MDAKVAVGRLAERCKCCLSSWLAPQIVEDVEIVFATGDSVVIECLQRPRSEHALRCVSCKMGWIGVVHGACISEGLRTNSAAEIRVASLEPFLPGLLTLSSMIDLMANQRFSALPLSASLLRYRVSRPSHLQFPTPIRNLLETATLHPHDMTDVSAPECTLFHSRRAE